jgi:hypothetical protein
MARSNKKEEEDAVFFACNEMFDAVDKLWHHLENEYPRLLKREASDEHSKILYSLHWYTRESIARDIITTIKNDNSFSESRFNRINEFLTGKIPGGLNTDYKK